MQDEFEMSMMGELKFFLGIQINQFKDGVYVYQSKYTKELLKKFMLDDYKVMTTPMHPTCTSSKEDTRIKVDQKLFHQYKSSRLPTILVYVIWTQTLRMIKMIMPLIC
jgi:protein-disulfide isomerase-like protein with CxxC motif